MSWTKGEDQVKTYVGPRGLGLMFCDVCGSTLCGVINGQVHGVALGCVDGDPGVVIETHLFVGSNAVWDEIGGEAPQYEEGLP